MLSQIFMISGNGDFHATHDLVFDVLHRHLFIRIGRNPQDILVGRPGRPTVAGGVAQRMSSQKLSRSPRPFSILTKTRSYNAALHHARASAMSAAQSTSTPSFLMTSARKSRLLVDVSTSRTRFFLSGPPFGSGKDDAKTGAVTKTPPLASKEMLGLSACAPPPISSTVLGCASVERSSVSVAG